MSTLALPYKAGDYWIIHKLPSSVLAKALVDSHEHLTSLKKLVLDDLFIYSNRYGCITSGFYYEFTAVNATNVEMGRVALMSAWFVTGFMRRTQFAPRDLSGGILLPPKTDYP